jgi:hypothetical protein
VQFGSPLYAGKELMVELSAAYLCAQAEISQGVAHLSTFMCLSCRSAFRWKRLTETFSATP